MNIALDIFPIEPFGFQRVSRGSPYPFIIDLFTRIVRVVNKYKYNTVRPRAASKTDSGTSGIFGSKKIFVKMYFRPSGHRYSSGHGPFTSPATVMPVQIVLSFPKGWGRGPRGGVCIEHGHARVRWPYREEYKTKMNNEAYLLAKVEEECPSE